jgi:enediyne biosynthesis protein E4
MRGFARKVATAACLVLAAMAVVSPAAAQDIDVVLHSSGDLIIGQGNAIAFTLDVQASQNYTIQGELSVSPTGDPASAVPFEAVTISVEAGVPVSTSYEVFPSQWFSETGSYSIWMDSPQASVEPLAFTIDKSHITVPRFQDVTADAGLTTQNGDQDHCLGDTYSSGAAWGDVEGDGDLDLYLPGNTGAAHLWVNDGTGHFTDRASESGVTNDEFGIAATFADYDNDGDPDLHVVNRGPDRLYRNDGTGHFVDVAQAAGVAGDLPGASAAWGDYNSDGHLDLYVVTWGKRCDVPGDQLWTYYADALYRNNGDGTFTDVADYLHITGSTMGTGLQAAWVDYDLDGDVDLYLANDFTQGPGAEPNVLWRNDGPSQDGGSWVFTNVSGETKAGIAVHSMGIAIGDYDRDLDFDMAISNIGPTALMRNQQGKFQSVAKEAGVQRPFQQLGVRAITWGLDFEDLNNDGWEDLYVAAGPLDKPTLQPNELFTNARDGTFLDHSAPSGADDVGVSRGVAFADYDRDGDVDLYVVNQSGEPHLFRNITDVPRNHWLEVRLIGRKSNRDGCGARLTLHLSNAKLLRQAFCGSTSFGSGNDPAIHFGLGRARRIEKLSILWPSGKKLVRRDLSVDRLLTLREPR